MRTKLTFAALAVAAGFAASPVLAQSTSQPEGQQPGMGSMTMPGQQQQGSSGCPCCQKMAMHTPSQGQPAPAPR